MTDRRVRGLTGVGGGHRRRGARFVVTAETNVE